MSELKPCPFCGCLGEDLKHDHIGIIHECCGFVEWNEWNERPIEDALRARIAELEAKLVRVAGIVESNLTPVYDEYGNGEVSLVGPCLELCVENTEKLRAILSDTRNPLAVVKCGFDPSQCEWPSGSIEMLVDCTDGYNPTDDGFVPVTVIVMPRESEGE